METIFINTESSRTNEPHRLELDLTGKFSPKNPKKNILLVMSRTRFRVNPHSIVAWMPRNSLLEAGAKSEGDVTATGLETRTT